jgi:hypothetical protein
MVAGTTLMWWRWALVLCLLGVGLSLPAASSAAYSPSVVIAFPRITFKPSANPGNPARETIQVVCPGRRVAVSAIRLRGAPSVALTQTTVTQDGRAMFAGRNYSGSPQTMRVVVRCVGRIPSLAFKDVYGDAINLGPGATRKGAVGCPPGYLAVGFGEHHPNAGRTGVSSRIRSLHLGGGAFSETIQSTGSAAQRIRFEAVCLQKSSDASPYRISVVPLATQTTLAPGQFGELGTPCPGMNDGFTIIGALITEFQLQDAATEYYPVPYSPPDVGTRFAAPASVYNASGTTAYGAADCLGYQVR